MGYELVEWRVEQAHGDAVAVHGLEDAFEVAALHRQELGQCDLAALYVVGENHLADGLDAVALEEHMLGAAQADALGSEVACLLGIARGVGVGAHECLGVLVGEVHDCAEVAAEFGFCGWHLAVVDVAGGAVEGNPVALVVYLAAHLYGLGLVVDAYFAGAGYAALAHAAGHYCGVAGHAAAHGEDALGHEHAAQVLRRGLDADEDDFLLLVGPGFGVVGLEDDLAGGCAGACGKALGDYLGTLEGVLVEDGVEEFVELVGLHAEQGGLLVDLAGA